MGSDSMSTVAHLVRDRISTTGILRVIIAMQACLDLEDVLARA